MGGPTGPDDASQGHQRALGEEGDAGMPGSSRESTADVPSPEGAGRAGRWEQQLCSFWKMCEPRSLPRDGGAGSALITPAAVFQAAGRAQQAQGHIPAALAHVLGTPHGLLVSAVPRGSGSAPAALLDRAAEP